MIPIHQAQTLIRESVTPMDIETVRLEQAVGRYLAEAVLADRDSPPWPKSVMDGYAVRSEDIRSGTKKLEVTQTILAGAWPEQPIGPGQAAQIMTGAPLPDGADAVAMVEVTSVETIGDTRWVTIEVDDLPPGRHWMHAGQNFREGQNLFSAGHRIRPADIGLLAEIGAVQLTVRRQPSVSILATGDELVPASQTPNRAQIRNSNAPMLHALLAAMGAQVQRLPIGRDDPDGLFELIQRGLQSDLLLLTGGVSAGIRDLVPEQLERLGVRPIFHKVAIKPGKPIWFGILDNTQPAHFVFGLPGNPVSSLVGVHLFVRTAMERLLNIDTSLKPLGARLASDHSVRGGRPTYWPGRWIDRESVERRIEPVKWQGSSDLRALATADALIHFPPDRNHYEAETAVQVYPLEF